jgi:hypothetical protein
MRTTESATQQPPGIIMISQPEAVTDVIRTAVAAVDRVTTGAAA